MSIDALTWLTLLVSGWSVGFACGILFMIILHAIFEATQKKQKKRPKDATDV